MIPADPLIQKSLPERWAFLRADSEKRSYPAWISWTPADEVGRKDIPFRE
jgi:hypothetical protein